MPFYRFLRRHNRKIVMGAFGMDYYYIDACLDCKTFRYSDFNIGGRVRHYPLGDAFIADWYEGEKGKLCRAVAEDSDKIVTKEEFYAIAKYFEENKYVRKGIDRYKGFNAMVRFMYFTGCRIGEVLAVT